MSMPQEPGHAPGDPPQPESPDNPSQPDYSSGGFPPPGPVAPPPGPQGYDVPSGSSAQPRPRSRVRMAVLAIVALVIVGGVVGVFVMRDRLGGEAAGLQVGDCIDLPTDEAEFTDVQHQPCNEPHDAEVFAVLTHPAAPDAAYPVLSGFDDYALASCGPAFQAYTGRSFDTDTELTFGWFAPTMTGWRTGDRGLTCHAMRVDDAKLSASVKVGAPASP